jgi:hypothetical protein
MRLMSSEADRRMMRAAACRWHELAGSQPPEAPTDLDRHNQRKQQQAAKEDEAKRRERKH